MSEQKPAILFFGNLPPPYGGLPSHFEFMIPELINAGYTPVILVRQLNDYSRWEKLGAYVYHLPHEPVVRTEEIAAFKTRISDAEFARCESLCTTLQWVGEPELFLGNLAFADRITRAHSIQLIHTYHLYSRSAVALALKTLHSLPAFLTIFGEVVSEYLRIESLKPGIRWALEQFEAILATSCHCGSGAELVGIPPDRVHVIPYGIDFTFFRQVDPALIIQKYDLRARDIVLFQGRMSQEKGPQLLIEALPILARRLPRVMALFVGPDDGPAFEATGMTEILRSRVSELGLADHVKFVGAVPFQELPLFYSAAHVLAFPSTSAKECMGLAIKQAMACQLPVVVGHAGGACEAIEDGITGICCEPNDPAALANSLLEVLTSPHREAMGKAGYERGWRMFRQERTLEELLSLYRTFLKREEPD